MPENYQFGASFVNDLQQTSVRASFLIVTQPTTDPTEFVTFQTDCFDNQQLFLAKFCRKKSVLRKKIKALPGIPKNEHFTVAGGVGARCSQAAQIHRTFRLPERSLRQQ